MLVYQTPLKYEKELFDWMKKLKTLCVCVCVCVRTCACVHMPNIHIIKYNVRDQV